MVQRDVVEAAHVLHLKVRGVAGADRDELVGAAVDVHAVQLAPAEGDGVLVLNPDAGPRGVGLTAQRVLACVRRRGGWRAG